MGFINLNKIMNMSLVRLVFFFNFLLKFIIICFFMIEFEY